MGHRPARETDRRALYLDGKGEGHTQKFMILGGPAGSGLPDGFIFLPAEIPVDILSITTEAPILLRQS